jgi:hypothetical protein
MKLSYGLRCAAARPVVLILRCLLLASMPQSVEAGFDWCSVDPTLTFTRGGLVTGLLRTGVVDVQVLVPLSALPLAGPARLTVRVPSNVQGTQVLNTSLPLLFTLRTTFAQVKPAVSTSPYQVELILLVPAGEQSFPVRLVVTNPSTGQITITRGLAGQKLRQTITIVE